MSINTLGDLQSSRGARGMRFLPEKGERLYGGNPGYMEFGKRGSIKVPPYEDRIRGGERGTKAFLSWLEGSEAQADRADEVGSDFVLEVHSAPPVRKNADGSISISLHAPSAEAAMRVVLAETEFRVILNALVRGGFEPSRPAERIDEMNGVIREIAESEVSVSLFEGEEEFCVELPRKIFESGHVPLREDEGFEFFVERYSDNSEKPIVRPLPRRELSPEEREQIVNEIDELLDGD